MRSKRKFRNNFELIVFFVLVVFVILVLTMALIMTGMKVLEMMGYTESQFTHAPVLVFSVATIIVGSTVAAIVSHIPLAPLQEVIAATKRFAKGDFSARINLKGPKELKQLSDSFNEMGKALGSIELLRNDFVNNFSHEFKTPIVSIRGFAKMLRDNPDLTDAEKQEYLEIIINESERLSELSSSVLNLSQVETQTVLKDIKRVNITEQMRLILVLLEKRWQDKNLDIHLDAEEVEAEVNEELMQQVFINLIDNAIKFSDRGTELKLEIFEGIQEIKISITNEGETISKEDQRRVFDKFYQGDGSHATKGNGLGLSLVQKIIDLHQGSITIRSENGKTTFTIFLPK